MKKAFLIIIVGLYCVMVAGCAGVRGGNGGAHGQEVPMTKNDECPVGQLSTAQIQNLIESTKKDETAYMGGASRLIERSGRLVFGLSALNVSDTQILRSIQAGKFLALMRWLQEDAKTVDLEHFSKCEE